MFSLTVNKLLAHIPNRQPTSWSVCPGLHAWTLSMEIKFYLPTKLLNRGRFQWQIQRWAINPFILNKAFIALLLLLYISIKNFIHYQLILLVHKVDITCRTMWTHSLRGRISSRLTGALLLLMYIKWTLPAGQCGLTPWGAGPCPDWPMPYYY